MEESPAGERVTWQSEILRNEGWAEAPRIVLPEWAFESLARWMEKWSEVLS